MVAQPGHTLSTRTSLAIALLAALLVCGCGGAATDDAVKGAGKLVGAGGDDAGRAVPKFESQLDTGATALGDDAGRGSAAAAYERERYEQAVQSAFCEGWAIYQDYGGWPTSDEWYAIIEDSTRAYNPSYGRVYRLVSAAENFTYAVNSGNITAAQLEVACAF